MFERYAPYMRIRTDDEYDNMSEQELNLRLAELHESDDNLSLEERRAKLKSLERTRNFIVWHDNSTVANHGFLVCMIGCLYDPAVFYTNDEYLVKTGKHTDVQKVIEKPEVNFIARCGSSDQEQMLYTETRLECIQGLKENLTTEEIEFVDKLRFCHGDSPARAFEAGQQKGGNYYCTSCGIHAIMGNCLDHILNCGLVSFKDRQAAVLRDAVSRRNSILRKPKPLNGLSKEDLIKELNSRGIYEGSTKKELETLLSKEMRGQQRVPALLFNSPQAYLKDLGLETYEVLPVSSNSEVTTPPHK